MNDEYNHNAKSIMEKSLSKEIRILIGDFSILWNLYEKYLYEYAKEVYANDYGNKEKYYQENIHYGILKIIKDKTNNFLNIEEDINKNFEILKYFLSNQYININLEELMCFFRINNNANSQKEITELFDSRKQFVNNLTNRFHLLLIVIYRVRNNMFHGSKAVITLSDEKDLFIIGCNIISMMLEPLESKIKLYGNRR